jgi:hypothetical protein
MSINYNNSKVYKIWSPKGDMIYIGSTTKQYLSQRMTAHRGNYRYWNAGKGEFITSYLIFDEYGLDNCFIELLEAKLCNSRDELNQLEGGYIRNLKCVNRRTESRTKKEYHEDNKVKFSELSKGHYRDNREVLIEKAKKHYYDNKEQVLERHKQYYEDNKETILEKQKQYNDNNKERKSEMNKQVIECSCGKTYTHGNKSRHNKSAFHLNNKKEQI